MPNLLSTLIHGFEIHFSSYLWLFCMYFFSHFSDPMLALAIEASILINHNESFYVTNLLETFRYTLKQMVSLRKISLPPKIDQ